MRLFIEFHKDVSFRALEVIFHKGPYTIHSNTIIFLSSHDTTVIITPTNFNDLLHQGHKRIYVTMYKVVYFIMLYQVMKQPLKVPPTNLYP